MNFSVEFKNLKFLSLTWLSVKSHELKQKHLKTIKILHKTKTNKKWTRSTKVINYYQTSKAPNWFKFQLHRFISENLQLQWTNLITTLSIVLRKWIIATGKTSKSSEVHQNAGEIVCNVTNIKSCSSLKSFFVHFCIQWKISIRGRRKMQ